MSDKVKYPIHLNVEEIKSLIPHRNEMLFAKSLTVLSHDSYEGYAIWDSNLSAIRGHFPALALVPGVYLVEALAQLAGSGMLIGDAYVKSLGKGYVGVLASIRKTSFKLPVLPNQEIFYKIRCRQVALLASQVTAKAYFKEKEVADLEILLGYTPMDKIQTQLSNSG